ncbi:MAG: O-antigen ligase family protein [Candidatus Omnitrophota bacterium]
MLFFIPISKATLEVCFGWAMLLFTISLILRKDSSVFKDRVSIFLLIFFISGFLSLFNTEFFAKSLKAIFLKWFEYIMLFFIFKEAVLRGLKPKFIFFVIIVSSILVGIDGVYQFFNGKDFLMHNSLTMATSYKPQRLVSASMGHPNGLANFLLFPLFLLLFNFNNCKTLKHKVINLINFTFFLIILFLTYSRGAWLGFFISFLVIIFVIKDTKLKNYLFAVLLSILIFIFILSSLFFKNFITKGSFYNVTRIELWFQSLSLFKEHPIFGIGIGTFMDYSSQFVAYGALYLHNCYLQILIEQGIVGLIAFIIFVFIVIKDSIRVAFFSKNELFLGLVFAIIAFLIQIFFDNHLYSLRPSFLFWCSMGIIRGLTLKAKQDIIKNST